MFQLLVGKNNNSFSPLEGFHMNENGHFVTLLFFAIIGALLSTIFSSIIISKNTKIYKILKNFEELEKSS
jgi:hypothetical protein